MYTGLAISLAWPQTWCKQSGSWYDSTMKLVGINKNSFYKVGHAAVILVESATGKCHYFDFGRYHAPYGYGRVTSINFKKAYQYAKRMQDDSPWKYGPFTLNGTNCSRFVRTVVLSGNPPLSDKLKIYLPLSISPTPIGNVKSLRNKILINEVQPSENR